MLDVQTSGLPLLRVVGYVVGCVSDETILQELCPRSGGFCMAGDEDALGRRLERWAPPGVWSFISEQLRNPEKLVECLGKVCCRLGNPEEAQISARAWPTPTELCSTSSASPRGGELDLLSVLQPLRVLGQTLQQLQLLLQFLRLLQAL